MTSIVPSAQHIKGRIDFFINGDIRWGIELVRNGKGLDEHSNRFSSGGKYRQLGAKDYCVVDIRDGRKSVSKKQKPPHDKHLFTIWFTSNDFKQCTMHTAETTTIIQLMD